MLKRIFDTSNRNRLKINAIYILLAISNIALFAGLINHYINVGFGIDINILQDVLAVIASIIILGFISYRLPNIKKRGDHPIYGMSALILVCAIGFVTSYFNHKLNMPTLLDPYLDMFKYLSAVKAYEKKSADMSGHIYGNRTFFIICPHERKQRSRQHQMPCGHDKRPFRRPCCRSACRNNLRCIQIRPWRCHRPAMFHFNRNKWNHRKPDLRMERQKVSGIR